MDAPLRSIDDLLSEPERARLRADLAKISESRRRAADAAAHITLS